MRALSGFTVRLATESGDKLTRFGPFSSQCSAGNVKIRRGSWNEELFRILEGFPDLAHDDEVDACSGALEMLNPQMIGRNVYELYRAQYEADAQLQREPEKRKPPRPVNVRVKAPSGMGAVQTTSGRHINVGPDGIVEMSEGDAFSLIPLGCTILGDA